MVASREVFRRMLAVLRGPLGSRASRKLPPDPFGLPPEVAAGSGEAAQTRRSIENTIPRNFAGG